MPYVRKVCLDCGHVGRRFHNARRCLECGKAALVTTDIAKAPPEPTPEQIIQVKTWIVEGQQAGDIIESIAEHYPEQTPLILLSAVFEDLAEEGAETNEDLVKGFLLNAYRELYRRAFEINDFGAALSALRSFERVAL